MNAYEIFHSQTESTLNCLYLVVMCILPLLWFGDCTKTMSLLFKKIQMPNYERYEMSFEFQRNLQILTILVGIGMYYIHRRWRLHLQDVRGEALATEASFTETCELDELQHKLLKKMGTVIEENISKPLRAYEAGVSSEEPFFKRKIYPMEDFIAESPEIDNTSEVELSVKKKIIRKMPRRSQKASKKDI